MECLNPGEEDIQRKKRVHPKNALPPAPLYLKLSLETVGENFY